MPTPTPAFDRGLSEAIASEGTANSNSLANRLGQGQDFTQMDPATRQLIAEKAATVTGQRGLNTTPTAQEWIQRGYVSPSLSVPGTTPGASTPTTPSSGVIQIPENIGNGSSQSPYAALLEAINAGKNSGSTISEDQAYADELARQQGAMDAINARYASLIGEAKKTGEVQGMRAKAIANTTGSLYTPNTDASLAGVDAETARAVRALEAQRGAELANLTGNASTMAYQRAKDAADAARSGQGDYIQNLLSVLGLQQSEKQFNSDLALRAGSLTGDYQGSPTLDFLNYQQKQKNDAFDQMIANSNLQLSQDQLDLQRQQFLQPDYQFVTLADGGYGYFDPTSGTYQRLGTAVAPRSSGGGSVGSYGIGASDLSSIRDALTGSLGADNYTNTALYRELARSAGAAGSGSSFAKYFPPEAWLNPADPTATTLFGTNPPSSLITGNSGSSLGIDLNDPSTW